MYIVISTVSVDVRPGPLTAQEAHTIVKADRPPHTGMYSVSVRALNNKCRIYFNDDGYTSDEEAPGVNNLGSRLLRKLNRLADDLHARGTLVVSGLDDDTPLSLEVQDMVFEAIA